MKHKCNWLTLFLLQNVHEVEEDTKYLDEALTQVLQFRQHSQTEIVVAVCTSVISSVLRHNIEGFSHSTTPLFSYILRLRPPSDETGKKRFELVAALDPDRSDFTDGAIIKHIFEQVQARFDYQHVALATLDHGSGFAIFSEPDLEKRKRLNGKHHGGKLAEKGVVLHHPDHFARVHHLFDVRAVRQQPQKFTGSGALLRNFNHILQDLSWLKPPMGLTMDELAYAIKETFGSVDIILLRNCYMMTFDTGYTLRDVTKYLVATEGMMYFRAYDFDIWLDAIDRGAELEEIAGAAIMAFSKRPTSPEISTDTALFANELAYYPALNEVMNKMTQILIYYTRSGGRQRLRHCRSMITDIVHRDFPGARYQLVDAKLWWETAGSLFDLDSMYRRLLYEFLELHKKMVGGRSYVGHLIGNGEYGASGFSLYFPSSMRNIAASRSFYELYYAIKSQYRSQFTRDSYWDEFIGALFQVD